MSFHEGKVVEFTYINHRGVSEFRRVVPRYIFHGKSKWHPYDPKQWYLVATCLDRQSDRHFKFSQDNMQGWEISDDQTLPWRL